MKRFYKTASVQSSDTVFSVLLDDKPIKTPAGKLLVLPTRGLADAIGAEWQGQGEKIQVHTMPLMQLAATTFDHVPREREQMVERLMAYCGTDLVCHRVEEPKRLAEMQETFFTPALSWMRRRYDIDLRSTTELMAVEQPQAAKERMCLALSALNDWALMGVQTAALASGSIVLALGMAEKAFAAEDVFEAAEVESTYQIEKWGIDAELEKRRSEVKTELSAVQHWFELL